MSPPDLGRASETPLEVALHQVLEQRNGQGLLRTRQPLKTLDAVHVQVEGDGAPSRCVNFASNNYLGLTHHPRMVVAAEQAVKKWGTGSGASALVTGHTALHSMAEEQLARWKGAENATLIASGYQASFAAVQTLAGVGMEGYGGGVRFLLDKLAHASLIDAVAASGQPYRVFPHNGLEKLERLLSTAPARQLQVVISESIFSMDGDACDLRGLAELKRKHRFVLLLDEAHASGVYGPAGAGYAAEVGLGGVVDVTIVTLSKALGASGAAICGSKLFCSAVANFGRAAIYSTNVPPVTAALAMAALGILRDEPSRQQRVRTLARRVRAALQGGGVVVPAGDSPIIPVIVGGEGRALAMAQRLKEAGMLVVAIRPPTVARGASRLRVTLSCEHTDDEVQTLIAEVLAAHGAL